jgi:hypothetical protein
VSIFRQKKVWANVATGIGGFSSDLAISSSSQISAFGNLSGAATITVQYSADGVNYYDGPTQVLAGAGDFRIDTFASCAHVRLKSSANVTATAWIAAK